LAAEAGPGTDFFDDGFSAGLIGAFAAGLGAGDGDALGGGGGGAFGLAGLGLLLGEEIPDMKRLTLRLSCFQICFGFRSEGGDFQNLKGLQADLEIRRISPLGGKNPIHTSLTHIDSTQLSLL
jgi:hypothetical protein